MAPIAAASMPPSPIHPDRHDPPGAGGAKTKARDILTAIRTLQCIEQEQRPATLAERQALARFPGFGPVALSLFPDPVTGRYKDASWRALGEALQSLLSPEEYDSAKRTTFTAFYSSPLVIRSMHQALAHLGVPRDATLLEPGCGTGNFIAQAPKDMRFIGVELDQLSGRIARALHPAHDIRIENFRDTHLPEDRIDAVIGNVPFADVKLAYGGKRLSLHDFFFAKSLDALKPGGVLALVTSHYTLDKQNDRLRQSLAERADFLGAIRLPSEAFKREGTQVVTDIVFLRKRAPGESNYSLHGSGDLAEHLRRAVARLPQGVSAARASTAPTEERIPLPPLERHVTEGSFFVGQDKTLMQVQHGEAVPVTHGERTLNAGGTMMGQRLASLVELRDQARRVLKSQNEDWPEAQRQAARFELNRVYNRFVATYGPINKTSFSTAAAGNVVRRMPNLVKFRDDPDAMLVMSLEDYDEMSGTAVKTAIMEKDVVGRSPPITSVQSAEEGLLVSLNQRGTVDFPFIASLYHAAVCKETMVPSFRGSPHE